MPDRLCDRKPHRVVIGWTAGVGDLATVDRVRRDEGQEEKSGLAVLGGCREGGGLVSDTG